MHATLAEPGSQYSDIQKREAIGVYLVHGNIQKVSKIVNIPDRTLYDWSKKEWWLELVAEMREENKEELDAMFSKGITDAVGKLSDRINYGDAYVTKDGDVALKPMTGRDLATVTGIIFDKRQLLRNQATSIKAESTDSRLNSLAEKVRELQAGSNKVISGEAKEVK